MSYLHCPACSRAYNVVVEVACPKCGIRPGAPPADPIDDVVAAAEQLARAMARATPDQLVTAETRLAQPRLGSGDAASPILRAVRAALAPSPPLAEHAGQQALLATVAFALLTRLAPPRPLRWARALLARF